MEENSPISVADMTALAVVVTEAGAAVYTKVQDALRLTTDSATICVIHFIIDNFIVIKNYIRQTYFNLYVQS